MNVTGLFGTSVCAPSGAGGPDCYCLPMGEVPLLVFSPHLDDAVLSLGGTIASRPGSIVVTVLAGMPEDGSMLTSWDRECGFTTAADAMTARVAEDRQALRELGATPIHLRFLDGQYGTNLDLPMIWAIAEATLRHPQHQPVCVLGLGHPDHRVVSEAFLSAMSEIGVRRVWLAEDIPYCADQRKVRERVTVLSNRAYRLRRFSPGHVDVSAKERARSAYVSQLGMLEVGYGNGELDRAERVWSVRTRAHRPFGSWGACRAVGRLRRGWRSEGRS